MNVINALQNTYALFENWPPQVAGILTQIPAFTESDTIITSQPSPLSKVASNQYDITFDANILDAGTLTTLTPPQSPPRSGVLSEFQALHDTKQTHTLHYRPAPAQTLAPVSTPTSAPSPLPTWQELTPAAGNTYTIIADSNTELHPINTDDETVATFPDTTGGELKYELEQTQIVDQIIEEFAKDLPDMSDEYESQYTYSPPSQTDESTTDEEWMPSSSPSAAQEGTTVATPKKRTRPYGRGVEDRKIRKKEQNKNAATRYRQKKKLEMELVFSEEQQLAQRNQDLKTKLDNYVREMKYLKGLIREFYRKDKANKLHA